MTIVDEKMHFFVVSTLITTLLSCQSFLHLPKRKYRVRCSIHQGFFIAPQLVTESQAKAFKNAFIHACSDKQDNTETRLKSLNYSREQFGQNCKCRTKKDILDKGFIEARFDRCSRLKSETTIPIKTISKLTTVAEGKISVK